MSKTYRFSIPIIMAGILLGMFVHLMETSGQALASSGIKNVAGSVKPAQKQSSLLVTTLEDELNTDGDCSLREAIQAANTNTSVDACPPGDAVITDTISFDKVGIITVTSQLSVTAGGPLVIDGGGVITTSGGGTNRVWWLEEGSTVSLYNIAVVHGESILGGGFYNNSGNVTFIGGTFANNHADQCGGMYNLGTTVISDSNFIENDADGWSGAICNYGTMSIWGSDFSENTTIWSTGAISNQGSLYINNCSFINNSGQAVGGVSSYGTLTIARSTFSGNSGNYGGGISAGGETTIINSTFTGNTAGWGGGVASGYQGEGDTAIINSTITGNSADSGGGIYNNGNTSITNCTISGNIARDRGGGIFTSAAGFGPSPLNIIYSTISDNSAPQGGGILNYAVTTLSSSIIANSTSGNDCQVNVGSITDAGHNLDSDGSCGLDPAKGSLPDTDPLLGPLQDNGGPTLTSALLPGSSAIDAGDNDQCPTIDQRGILRPVDGDEDGVPICDIGSFEYQVSYSQRFYLPIISK